jgi:hypothetical protein
MSHMYLLLVHADDTVGHWQVMAHPTKRCDKVMSQHTTTTTTVHAVTSLMTACPVPHRQWTRVLYSTGVVLPKLIPSFVVNYVLKTGLVEVSGPS